MKRETVYWILLLGVLTGISAIYTNSKNFDQSQLIQRTNGAFRTVQIGDLYVLKDKTQKVVRFFKVAGSPKSDSVFVLRGNPSYNENIIDSEWIKKIIDRPIYFEPNLQRISKNSLSLIHYEEGINFTLYRQVYPAEYYPIIMYVAYSPLTIILLILIVFFIIWLTDIISLYLHSCFPKIPNIFYRFLIGFSIATIVGWVQWNGYVVYLESQNLEVPRSIWFPTVLKNLLEILPVFGLFYFLKKKYLGNLNFGDEEFLKFVILFFGGIILNLLIIGLFYQIVPTFGISQISIVIPRHMSLIDLFQQYSLIWGIIAIANFLNNLRKNWRQLREQSSKLIENQKANLSSQSALDALQARVNPHFLYNSLNSIASLAQTNPAKTEEMALALSDFYKHSTNRQAEHISTVAVEIKQLQTYLAIEKIRFGDRLQYHLNIAKNTQNIEIPRFLLQPLVENAIKYGFNKTKNKIEITIEAVVLNEQIHLRIMDSGEPFSGQMNTGYGLRSIKKKLKLLYPNAHEIHFLNKPIKQVHIILETTKNH